MLVIVTIGTPSHHHNEIIMVTCFDLYNAKNLNAEHMCVGCSNYNGIILKKKTQAKMGRAFQCKGLLFAPPATDYSCCTPSRCIPANFSTECNDPKTADDYSTDSDSIDSVFELLSPPRKAVRNINRNTAFHHCSPRRHSNRVSNRPEILVLSPLRTRKKRNASSSDVHSSPTVASQDCSSIPNVSNSSQQQLLLALNNAREANIALQQELEEANERIAQLNLRVNRGKKKVHKLSLSTAHKKDPFKGTCHLLQKWKSEKVSDECIADGIIQAVASRSRVRMAFCRSIQRNDEILTGINTYFEAKVYKQLKYKFRPWLCLQELDLNASVSFRAYDAIRMIEFAEEENKLYRRGLFYSRHKLTKLCKMLEGYGKDLLPFTLTTNSVHFDVQTAVKFLLQKHGLWNNVINQERVLLAATVDGGDLAWGITQVSAGVKMIDHRAINPLTGTRLFGDTGHNKVQSRCHCYPLHVIMAKDNKELYATHLSNFFRDANMLEETYPDGVVVAQGADMCSLHKTLGVGGGMKVKKYACYCCNVHRDDLARPLPTPCADCVRLGRTLPCYHTAMSDENLIQRLRLERDEQVRTWPHLQQLFPFNGRSRIRVGSHGMNTVLEPQNDNLHIEYEPNSRMERVAQRSLFENELRLRGLHAEINRPTAELRLVLHEILLVEASFTVLDSIIKAKTLEDAMIRLEQALPCLLHLENRTSEAIIEHLLRRGLTLREGDKGATDHFIREVEHFVNTEIFGSIGCSALWLIPLNENGTVGKVKLANWRARGVLDSIEEIIAMCFPGEDQVVERNKWVNAIQLYRRTMKVSYLFVVS